MELYQVSQTHEALWHSWRSALTSTHPVWQLHSFECTWTTSKTDILILHLLLLSLKLIAYLSIPCKAHLYLSSSSVGSVTGIQSLHGCFLASYIYNDGPFSLSSVTQLVIPLGKKKKQGCSTLFRGCFKYSKVQRDLVSLEHNSRIATTILKNQTTVFGDSADCLCWIVLIYFLLFQHNWIWTVTFFSHMDEKNSAFLTVLLIPPSYFLNTATDAS